MCFNSQMKTQKGDQRKPRKRKRRRNADRQFFSLIFIMEKFKYIYNYIKQ